MAGNIKTFKNEKEEFEDWKLTNAYVNMRGILDVLHHIDKTFERNVRNVEIVSFWDPDSYDHSMFEGMRSTIKKYVDEWDAKETYVKPEDWKSKEYAEFYHEVEKAVYRKIETENCDA